MTRTLHETEVDVIKFNKKKGGGDNRVEIRPGYNI
jgi:hypothetical protein